MDFFLNNLEFAVHIAISIVFFTLSWLSYDSYSIQKDGSQLGRSIGYFIFGISNVAIVTLGDTDLYKYIFSAIKIIGLILILLSYLFFKKLEVAAVVLIPSYEIFSGEITLALAILSILISIASFNKAKREFNKVDYRVSIGFIFLALSYLVIYFNTNNSEYFQLANYLLVFISLYFFIKWLWHYMQLRFEESFVVILVSSALFLSAVITLAFSTLLVQRINTEVLENLSKDVKVTLFSIESLLSEANAKSLIVSKDEALKDAIASRDESAIYETSNNLMNIYDLGFLIISDENGTVLTRGHDSRAKGDSIAHEPGFDEALLHSTYFTIENSQVEGFTIRATSPVIDSDKLVGVVVAGFQLDNAFLDKIKRITGLDLFIFNMHSAIASTAFSKQGNERLTSFDVTDNFVLKEVFENGKEATKSSSIKGIKFRMAYAPLKNNEGKTVGMVAAAKQENDILTIINDTNRLTLISVIVILMVLSTPIYYLSRRIIKSIK